MENSIIQISNGNSTTKGTYDAKKSSLFWFNIEAVNSDSKSLTAFSVVVMVTLFSAKF